MLPQAVLAAMPPVLLRNICRPREASLAPQGGRQLLVDVSVVVRQDSGTGIHRVVRALLDQLRQAPPPGFVVRPVAATRRRTYHYAAYPNTAGSDCVDDVPVTAGQGDIFLVLDLTANVLPRNLFQVMAWKRAGVSVHFVVYDLLPLRHPEWFSARLVRNFGHWSRALLVLADGVICISRSVEADVANWLSSHNPVVRSRIAIGTIPLGADIAGSVPSRGVPDEVRDQLALLRGQRTVLMVGTLEPRKGHALTLRAFEHLWAARRDYALVIVGRPGWKTEVLQAHIRSHPELNRRLFWFDGVSDEFLEHLYGAVDGLLAASEAEGYGLPLIEAARYGAPVLARDIPVFREVAGPLTTFFRSDTPARLADEVEGWLAAKHVAPSDDRAAALPTWADSAAALRRWLSVAPGAAGKSSKWPTRAIG